MSMGGGSAAKQPKAALGLQLQSSQYGSTLPVLLGRNKAPGIVLYYSDFKATKHQEKQQGGKGGGQPKQYSYTYSASFQLAFFDGQGSVVTVYNGPTSTTLAAAGGLLMAGTLGQAPWAHLTGLYAIGYSGTCGASFQDYQLGDNPSLPNLNFECAGPAQYNVGGGLFDADPRDILTTICTDPLVGVGFSGLGDLTQMHNYCVAAGLMFSPFYDQQMEASQPLEDLFKYANCGAWFSEGVLKVVPFGDAAITGNGATYTPNLTAVADLGPNDFITNGTDDPVTIKRKAPADARNLRRVEFRDRSLGYRTNAVQASIDVDVNNNGARSDNSDSINMITSAATARLVAENLLLRDYYIRNTYEFQLSWRYCALEPMDIVTLTDANTGLNLTPVRITEVTEDEEGLLSFVAEEMPQGIGHGGTYSTQGNGHVPVDPNADPGAINAPYVFRAPGFLVSPGAPEIWCALAGSNPYWAGCDVYISNDNVSFEYVNTFARESTYGYVTNTMTAGADLDNTNVPNVVLNGGMTLRGGNATDRDNFNTMAMVDTEIISYQNATLAAGPSYNLSSLRRGGFGTARVTHATNAPFVRLDDNIFRMPMNASRVGQTVYLKFVSYNCFGLGGRTLASETSYPYVIGSNIEFPDVPVVPSAVTAIGVADGVNLTWFNANPAAVGCTSIEYATSSGGPWTVLAQPGTTSTGYHHAFTGGGTYFYRLRSRGHQVSGGWSSYTSTVTASSVNVAAIKSEVDDISNDNKISPPEKPALIIDYNTLTGEQSGLDSQASAFGITTEKTDYDTKMTSLTSYMATLTSPVLWSNKTDSTNVVGSTMRAKFTDVTTARTVLVSKISSVAKAIADGKILYFRQTTTPSTTVVGSLWFNPATGLTQSWDGSAWVASGTASASSGNGDNLVSNPTFLANNFGMGQDTVNITANNTPMCDGWYAKQVNAARVDTFTRWYAAGAIRLTINGTVAIANGSSVIQSAAVSPQITGIEGGRTYKFQLNTSGNSFNGSFPGGLTVLSRVTVRWYDNTGAQISYLTGCSRDRTSGAANGLLVAPSNAQTCELAVEVVITNATGASWTHNSSVAIDAWFRFVSMAKVQDLDSEVNDGTQFGRTDWQDLWTTGGTNRIGLRFGGSGQRIGDSRNLHRMIVGNGVAKVPTVITYTASAGTPATATISVAAWTMLSGSITVAYSAKSVGVTGTNGTTVVYYLYLDDPDYTGTGTLVATTVGNNVYGNDGRVYIGDCSVTFPASGSGGGGGGRDPCVCPDMYLHEDLMAVEANVGHLLDCLDLPTGDAKFKRRIQAISYAEAECVELRTEDGSLWRGSRITPFDLLDGRSVQAHDMYGEIVVTDHGLEQVVSVTEIGVQPVVHISVGGISYAAGADPARRIYSHNANKP